MPTSLPTLSLFVVPAGKHLVSAIRCRAREFVRELLRVRVPLDLALTGRRDDPEPVLAERVHGNLADGQERTRVVRLPGCRLAHVAMISAKTRELGLGGARVVGARAPAVSL